MSSSNGVQAGELGRGKFSYVCGVGADAQCNSNADLPQLNMATNLPNIALGAEFGLGFTSNDGATYSTQSEDPAFLVFDATTNQYQAVQTGEATLYGLGSGGDVEDLVQVTVVPVDHLEFAQTQTTGGSFKGEVTLPGLTVMVSVSAGPTTQLLRVVPMTQNRELIAGSLPCLWTTDNMNIASITTDPTQNIITIQLNQAGTTTLHVTLGALSGDVTVTAMGS